MLHSFRRSRVPTHPCHDEPLSHGLERASVRAMEGDSVNPSENHPAKTSLRGTPAPRVRNSRPALSFAIRRNRHRRPMRATIIVFVEVKARTGDDSVAAPPPYAMEAAPHRADGLGLHRRVTTCTTGRADSTSSPWTSRTRDRRSFVYPRIRCFADRRTAGTEASGTAHRRPARTQSEARATLEPTAPIASSRIPIAVSA